MKSSMVFYLVTMLMSKKGAIFLSNVENIHKGSISVLILD